MAIIIDSVTPEPVVVPRGGTTSVLVLAHVTSEADDPGTLQLVYNGQVLFEVDALVDSATDPAPPVPWNEISLVPVGLDGVVTLANGSGSFTVSHNG